jgi:hypothetical protein
MNRAQIHHEPSHCRTKLLRGVKLPPTASLIHSETDQTCSHQHNGARLGNLCLAR